MKSAFAATVLAAAASSAMGLQLAVKSSDASVDGMGVSSIHEGAAINYMFLGQNSETYIFDPSTNSIQNGNMGLPAPAGLSVLSQLIPAGGNPVTPVLTFSPGVGPDMWTFDASGTLQLNGTSTGFFACMNFDDPADLSTTRSFLTFYGTTAPPASQDCVALTIVEVTNSTETSSSAAASSAAATSAVESTAAAAETSAVATAPAVSETNAAGKLTVGAAALVAAAAMLL